MCQLLVSRVRVSSAYSSRPSLLCVCSDKTRSKLHVLALYFFCTVFPPINAHFYNLPSFLPSHLSFLFASLPPVVTGMTVVETGATEIPTVIVETAIERTTVTATGTETGGMVVGTRTVQGRRTTGDTMITTTATTMNDTEAQRTITTLIVTMTTVTTMSETTMGSMVTIVQSTKVEAGAQ